MSLIKLSPMSERPPVRVFASTAVRDAYVVYRYWHLGDVLGLSVQFSYQLPDTSVKGFTSVLASFGFLGASLLPASGVLLLWLVIFPPKGISMHLIVILLLLLLANHVSVNACGLFIYSPLFQECVLFPLINKSCNP